jgi:SAM-dependent methyltransferase
MMTSMEKKAARRHVDPYQVAHGIAFAPLTFQAALAARDRGLLKALDEAGPAGLSAAEAARRSGLSLYAARVLLEGCASIQLVEIETGDHRLTQAGWLLLHDDLVRVNMDFSQDVCYQGAAALGRSLETGKPEGLKAFGPWSSIYEGLLRLPPQALKSWLAFDHRYSDGVFEQVLPSLFRRPLKRLLDVGGNTGKFALLCLRTQPELEHWILDHPAQLAEARRQAEAAGVGARLRGEAMDLLDHSRPFPAGFDAVWMSQFLDCFGEDDVRAILRRARAALAPGGRVHILETYWDRQPNPVAAAALQATSLYFTCMANGQSKMFHSDDIRRLVAEAGLRLDEEEQHGFHTLFSCVAA